MANINKTEKRNKKKDKFKNKKKYPYKKGGRNRISDNHNNEKVILIDVEKYYCSKHKGNGNPKCNECWNNLKRLAEDNKAVIFVNGRIL